jgi:BolA protein
MSLKESILGLLKAKLSPQHIEVVDESAMHSRRTPDRPETHFKIIIVSNEFEGLSRVQRQQRVYEPLKDLFAEGLHAVTQNTFTPAEWAKQPELIDSPSCVSKKKNC